MADRVNPSGTRAADAKLTAGAMRYGGGDWIVPAGEDYYAGYSDLTGVPLGGFSASTAADSLTVTIDTGEAFVIGAWLGRDTATQVQLSEAKNGQTVYVGWAVGATNKVLVGLNGAFSDDDPRIAIHEFDTDTNGVTSHTDLRPVGEQIDVRNEGSAASADTAEHVTGANVDGQVSDAAHADNADNSDELGGEPASDYLRSDGNDSTSGRLGVEALRFRNIEFNNQPNTEGIFGYDNSEGLRYYHNGGWRRVYTSDYKQTKINGSSILTRDDESGLNVNSAADADNADALGQNVSQAQVRALLALNGNTIRNPDRIQYDDDKSGDPLFFQREASAAETALTLKGTRVGVGETDPGAALDVGGDALVNGSPVLRRADESGLDVNSADNVPGSGVNGTVSEAENANAIDKKAYLQHLVQSPNITTGMYEIPSYEKVYIGGPFATRGGDMEVWGWGVMDQNGNANGDIRIGLDDIDGNRMAATVELQEVGDIQNDNPVEYVSSSDLSSRPQFYLRNVGSNTREFAGWCAYYIN